ncbi:baseplate J/gp47 family protein (plasmid) [Halorarum halophilum]|uniref:Baseplate J/gp47 family protein n=1 Tax=Halorarum halophilum TaxID=2743090 RepID=A0A7D5KW82_9EURY|nr:baseplate J/gp47 family protein [Halobaculum halophilum]QLG29980.1 baseplate J/gp47 family protein [Halobaculum halophilum]
MAYGVQDDGSFDRKFVDDIIADLETKIRQEAGNDVDLGQSSPVKQILDTVAIELAELWAAQEENYYASYFEDAFGDHLDKLLKLAGVSRIPRRPATGEVTFSTGSANASDVTIQKGTEVTTAPTENAPAIPFKTTESATLTAGSTDVTVSIKGLQPWETDVDEEYLGDQTNVASNTVTIISNPISGIDSVTNQNATGDVAQGYVAGRDRETDAEFKVRYRNTLSQAGSSTLDAIKSEIYNAHEDITAVSMDENTSITDNTGSGGLPGKSFSATVQYTGALEDTIAQAILDSRPAGIQAYGSTDGTATDDDGETYTQSFEEATAVDIYVDVTATGDGTESGSADTSIEDKIIAYIGGTDNNGLDLPGLEIGDDVIYDQVFAAALNVDGIQEADVTIGLADNPSGTANLTIAADEIARSDLAKIDVTVN